MTNIFRDEALPALAEVLMNDAATDVQYYAKELDASYGIRAAKGSINWGTLNKMGDVALGENYRDWITQASDLLDEPKPGDTITDGNDVFEVFNSTTSNKCWRYSDPYKCLIRIYTRRISK